MPNSLKCKIKHLCHNGTITERERDRILKALEREPCEQFVKWVATEIFDDMWEYNKDAFAEIACRKLAKLGIVIRMGDEWVLVDEEGEKECQN